LLCAAARRTPAPAWALWCGRRLPGTPPPWLDDFISSALRVAMPSRSRAAGARRDEWQQLAPTLQLDESVEAGLNASVAVTANSPRERRHKDDEATKWPKVDWLKGPEASISMVWRWFHLPSYFAERHKKEADLMRDLQQVKQKIVAEPGMTSASVRKIRQHTEQLADTTSALRAIRPTRGYSATAEPKKVPFDCRNAKLDAEGWPREPRSDKDEEVRLYSIWATTPAELGNIGGVGLRLYFFILKFLAGVFFAMGFITARADTFWVALIPLLSVCLPGCLPCPLLHVAVGWKPDRKSLHWSAVVAAAITSFASDRLYSNPDCMYRLRNISIPTNRIPDLTDRFLRFEISVCLTLAWSRYFRTPMSLLTLGNVYTEPSDVTNGTAPVLMVASETDAVATLVALVAIMWLGGFVKKVAAETDLETITMQDYSVQVIPVRPVQQPAGRGGAGSSGSLPPWDSYSSGKNFLCEVRAV
jgi:hypothetical protein